MLGRRSSVSETPLQPDLEPATTPAGKGRATPKRAAARKARRNATPKNRKEAAALQRERNRESRRLARQSLMTGDERHLPARDAGPEKRLARDIVDSRFTLGQVLFGLIFLAYGLALVPNDAIRSASVPAALLLLTVMVLDGARIGRRAKVAVVVKYGVTQARGISAYAFMRSLLPRRFRRPPPKVRRGAQVLT
jgi:hypothetical protein